MIADITCKWCSKLFRAKTMPSKVRIYCGRDCSAHASRNMKHGLTDTIEHRAWARIRRRCNSPTYHNYPRYGGRGISVCERWDVFENFLADMGPRPGAKYSIERMDNDGNYEPSNCKWATAYEQSQNRSISYSAEEDEKIREAVRRGYNFRQMSKFVGTRSHSGLVARAYRLGLKSGQPIVKITDRVARSPQVTE